MHINRMAASHNYAHMVQQQCRYADGRALAWTFVARVPGRPLAQARWLDADQQAARIRRIWKHQRVRFSSIRRQHHDDIEIIKLTHRL